MATQIKLRRDTAANWLLEDPTLAQGEPGFETNTGKLKIGDGLNPWSALDYIVAEPDGSIDLSAVDQHIIPATDNLYDLGSPTNQWRHAYIANGSLYIGDIKLSNSDGTLVVQQVTDPGLVTEEPVANTPGIVTTDRIVNGAYNLSINSTGELLLNGEPFTGGGGGGGGGIGQLTYQGTWNSEATYIAGIDVVDINQSFYLKRSVDGNSVDTPDLDLNAWVKLGDNPFDQNLNSTDTVTFSRIWCPDLRQNSAWTASPNGVNVPGATPTVVFTAPNWFTSFKLVIAVEGRLDGDGTNVDHTQTCEATIAATFNTTAEPIMSVYGIVYTSPAPLATFTVARNGGNIEVTAVNSQTTNNLDVRVQAIQFVSRYY